MKKCSTCKKEQPLDFFYKRAKSPDGYMNRCKECSKLYKRKWAAQNKEKIREYDTEYRKRQDRQEYMKQYLSEHQQQNKALWNHKNSIHRAKKLQRTPQWLNEDQLWFIKEIYELAQLRTKVTGVEHHVDHIVPLKGKDVSGLHLPWNLQVIPWYENLSKSNKTGALNANL